MSESTVEARLRQLGVTLPHAPKPVGAYVGAVRTGNLVVTSGQLPWEGQRLLFTGKVGANLDLEQGYEAAKVCAVNALAQIKAVVGSLDRVRQIVRLEGYVHCAPGFRQQAQVLNGASDLFNKVFDEKGQHTRVALGITEMPLEAPVQLVVWADVEPEVTG